MLLLMFLRLTPRSHKLQIAQLFSFLVLLSACGTQPEVLDGAVIPPEPIYAHELMPLVSAYETDAAQAGAPVSNEFRKQLVQVIFEEDLGQEGTEIVLGRCERFNENHPDPSKRFRTVKIRKPDANGYAGKFKLDALTIKTIVYHELGHCLHDFRGHLPGATPQIMNTVLPKERFQSFHDLTRQHFEMLKSQP